MNLAGIALYSGIIPLTAENTILSAIISFGKFTNKSFMKADGVARITISAGFIISSRSVLTLILLRSNSTDWR